MELLQMPFCQPCLGQEADMAERFAIVTYEVQHKGNAGLGFGYLVETPDGLAWCFPSEETGEKFPDQAGAFRINPASLKPQPDCDNGRRQFLYRP
jgi:hypothetical protein